MQPISWRVLVVGLVGYSLFFGLFSRYHPSRDFKLELNREQAIERARSIGGQAGLEVQDWTAYTRAILSDESLYYRHQRPDQAGLFLAPALLQLRLAGPGQEFLDIRLGGDGSLVRFATREPDRSDESDEIVDVEPQEIERALRLIAGELWDRFTQSKDPEARNGITTLEFKATELSGPERVPRVVLRAVGGEIYSIRGEAGFSEPFDRSYSDLEDQLEVLTVVIVLIAVFFVIAGLARYALAMSDRVVKYRPILSLIGILVAVDFVQSCLGEGWQGAGIEDDGLAESALVLALKYVFTMAPFLIATIGAGSVLCERGLIDRSIHLDLLLRGEWRSRPVGAALLSGGLAAGALLCLPLLLVGVGLFPNALPAHHSPHHWYSFFPSLAYLRWFPEGPLIPIVGVVSLAYPWLTSHLRRVWVHRTLRVLLLTTFMAGSPFQYSVVAGLVAGFLGALLIDWIYQQSGWLAALSCGVFLAIFNNGMAMAVQSADSLSFNGWLVTLLGVATLGGLGLVAWRGKEIDFDVEVRRALQEVETKTAGRRAEREQLLAEFGVARRAQELMLPKGPPAVPGVEIAATCTPATEVGGDLFDFLPLPQGRTGVAVADVSGKGVPAAIYMTLAKGLLLSAASTQKSLVTLMVQVNGYFHECARRRVFATLALAVLDPDRGVVECARAGHNPILWWQASKGKIRWINPSGIGIGLAPNRLFSRSLAVEECHLQEGDVLIVYSDGIPEAMNELKEEYGMERMELAICQAVELDATQIRDALLADVKSFVGDTAPSDDITLVVLRFLGGWNARVAEVGASPS